MAIAETETVLHVRGMTCGNCVKHVQHALQGVPGVEAVQVDLASGVVRVTHAPTADVAQMNAAIEDAGYETTAPA